VQHDALLPALSQGTAGPLPPSVPEADGVGRPPQNGPARPVSPHLALAVSASFPFKNHVTPNWLTWPDSHKEKLGRGVLAGIVPAGQFLKNAWRW